MPIPNMALLFDKPLPEGSTPGEGGFSIDFGIGGSIDLGDAFGDTLFGFDFDGGNFFGIGAGLDFGSAFDDTLFGFDFEGDNQFGIGGGPPGGAFVQGGLPLNQDGGLGAIIGFGDD